MYNDNNQSSNEMMTAQHTSATAPPETLLQSSLPLSAQKNKNSTPMYRESFAIYHFTAVISATEFYALSSVPGGIGNIKPSWLFHTLSPPPKDNIWGLISIIVHMNEWIARANLTYHWSTNNRDVSECYLFTTNQLHSCHPNPRGRPINYPPLVKRNDRSLCLKFLYRKH